MIALAYALTPKTCGHFHRCLPVPALLPLDCLLGGINFTHTLLIQTIGPLAVIGALELAIKVLYKKAAMEAAKAANSPEKAPQPTSAFLAELFSNVSFFLLFLLYPGSSTKIFHALMCNTFDGEGEGGESFLRVVSRQHPCPRLLLCLLHCHLLAVSSPSPRRLLAVSSPSQASITSPPGLLNRLPIATLPRIYLSVRDRHGLRLSAGGTPVLCTHLIPQQGRARHHPPA